jgi:ParB-like chromosome segregation protein Spo0J
MKLSEIKPNPNNPRIIKDANFQKLVKSIEEFPKMMALRPIVVDADNMVLGGNMRLKALQHLKFKQIPDEWVKNAADLTEDEQRRFIIADNVSGGEWDLDMLENEWSKDDLLDWGVDILPQEKLVKKTEELKDFARSHILISYHPDRHIEITEILEKLNEYPDIEIESASN